MKGIFKKHWWWITSSLIALFAVIAAIFVFVNNSPKYVGWNAEGFEGFLAYFDFPLKILATAVITLTLSLSVKRLFKTEEQIRLSEAGSLRSNYIELAESYQNSLGTILNIDLKRNVKHFFPMMNQGNPELETSIRTALLSIIKTIQSVKVGTFGFVSGISLLPILEQNSTLKEFLIIDFPFSLEPHAGLSFRSRLLGLAKEFVHLAEFLSNFYSLLGPRDINSLKETFKSLDEKQNELTDLYDAMTNKDSAQFINDVDYNHRLFAYYYILTHTKDDGSFIFFLPDFSAMTDYDNIKKDPESDLNKYRELRVDLNKAYEKDGDIYDIIKSKNYKYLVNLISEDAGTSPA